MCSDSKIDCVHDKESETFIKHQRKDSFTQDTLQHSLLVENDDDRIPFRAFTSVSSDEDFTFHYTFVQFI